MKTQNPDENLSPQPDSERSAGNPAEEATVIPVMQEQVHIGKETVESGRVRISKSVSEQHETVAIPLNHEEVDVKRVAINQYVESAPLPMRQEGDTTIIPVLREVLVVEKRLLLVEELHVTKKQVQTKANEQVTLRKEEVKIERLPAAKPGEAPPSATDHK